MSSTNVTEFYGLTQYIGTDKPSFTDNNEAFRAVDAALHGAVADVADASDAITSLTGRVGDVEDAVTGLSGTVGTQGDAITVLQNKEISQDRDIADVKAAALDMVCAYNEEAAQSVHAYAIGDFFRYNDVLYKASAVINIGDTIIPNTNCVATNVTEQLLTDVDKVGDLSSLTTTDKTSAVAAINEVNAEIGDLSSLTTTDKTSAVAAINEVASSLSAKPNGYDWSNKVTLTDSVEYTVPSDGVIRLVCARTSGNEIKLANDTHIYASLSWVTGMSSSANLIQVVPVFKGTKWTVTASNTGDGSGADFIPYSYPS